MDIRDLFIAKATKYNQYIETSNRLDRRCIECVRWRFSYPYTCSSFDIRDNKAETCLNYTEDNKAPVD